MSDSQIQRVEKSKKEDLSASKYGYERYMTAKYYKNLTQSQYYNQNDAKSVYSGFHRESLNPAQNLARLRERIAVTDSIAARYTAAQRDWVRILLEKAGGRLWKYKFNYLIKFVVVYRLYSEIRNYNYLMNNTVMRADTQFSHFHSIFNWTGITALTFLFL